MITLREKLNKLPPERRQKIEERAQKLIDAENGGARSAQGTTKTKRVTNLMRSNP